MNAKPHPKAKTATWNLRGVSDEARAHAKAEAEAAGLSIGDWLNARILEAAAMGDGRTGYDRPAAKKNKPGDARDDDPVARIAEILRTGEHHMQTRIAALQGSIEHLSGRLEALEKSQKSGN
jgi:uncharacterized small protein (DUF1192 family)